VEYYVPMMVTSPRRTGSSRCRAVLQACSIGISKLTSSTSRTWISRLNVGNKYESTMNGWWGQLRQSDPSGCLVPISGRPNDGLSWRIGTGYKNDQFFDQLSRSQHATNPRMIRKMRLYDQSDAWPRGTACTRISSARATGASTNNLVLPTAKIQADIYDALPIGPLKGVELMRALARFLVRIACGC